jgi:hypothetical protein
VHDELEQPVFGLGDVVRYVAFGEGQHVYSRQRDNLADSSGLDSDHFEALFVNPALITLARQRGDLDCSGIRYLVVAYGNFSQLVVPTTGGHLSVALDRAADPRLFAELVLAQVENYGLAPGKRMVEGPRSQV